MQKKFREGAIGALLDEYERAINDLQNALSNVSDAELVKAVQPDNPDPDFISIQSIMTHVIRWGYAYPVFIRRHKTGNPNIEYVKTSKRGSAKEYINDLNDVLKFTEETFANITDREMIQRNNDKKLTTSYKQQYDYDQMMEHAIVHILRHRRQIERYMIFNNS